MGSLPGLAARGLKRQGLLDLKGPQVCQAESLLFRLDCETNQLGGAFEVQLLPDIGVMHGNRFGAQVQLPGNLLGGLSLAN